MIISNNVLEELDEGRPGLKVVEFDKFQKFLMFLSQSRDFEGINFHRIWNGLERLYEENFDIFKIDNYHFWEEKNLIIYIIKGEIIKYEIDSDKVIDITGDKLSSGFMATFIENNDIIVIANGGRMVFTNGENKTAYILP